MLRSLTLLLAVVCCTSKPETTPPSSADESGLIISFSGLEGALKHNVPFSVSVTVNGDISAAASGDATQALTITLSQRIGTGDWQKVGEEVAANNSATFDLTLSAGDYTLKAETKGAATLSQESSPFTVPTGEISGIELSFSEDSYTIKTGALFEVTVNVTESDKLEEDSRVALKLLKDDDSEVDMLMQWQGTKEAMQPLGEAISAEVDKDKGKAVFKDLFIVDAKDVAKLQAVLKGSSLAVEAEFKFDDAEVTLDDIELNYTNNNVSNFNFNPATISQALRGDNSPHGFDLYFFKVDSDPPDVRGPISGSAVPYSISTNVADFTEHCYDIAVRLTGDKRGAFLYSVAKSHSAPNRCK